MHQFEFGMCKLHFNVVDAHVRAGVVGLGLVNHGDGRHYANQCPYEKTEVEFR